MVGIFQKEKKQEKEKVNWYKKKLIARINRQTLEVKSNGKKGFRSSSSVLFPPFLFSPSPYIHRSYQNLVFPFKENLGEIIRFCSFWSISVPLIQVSFHMFFFVIWVLEFLYCGPNFIFSFIYLKKFLLSFVDLILIRPWKTFKRAKYSSVFSKISNFSGILVALSNLPCLFLIISLSFFPFLFSPFVGSFCFRISS